MASIEAVVTAVLQFFSTFGSWIAAIPALLSGFTGLIKLIHDAFSGQPKAAASQLAQAVKQANNGDFSALKTFHDQLQSAQPKTQG